MGFLYKSGRIRGFILIFLAFSAFAASIPLGNRFINAVNKNIKNFFENFQEETGLKISYDSLSPSILSDVFIRQIKISKDDEIILAVDKTKIGVKISKLLKGDIRNGISYVLIDGVQIELSKLLDFIKSIKKDDENDEQKIPPNVSKYVPQNIKLKNIDVIYDDEKLTAVVNLKKINFDNNGGKNIISAQFESDVNAQISNSAPAILNRQFSCKLNANANITKNFDEANFSIKISDFTDGTYKIGKLNLQAGYKNNKFEIQTVQVVHPISVGVKFDVLNKIANAQLKTEKLAPFEIISANSRRKDLQKFKNVLIDTDTIVNCNLSEKSVNFISDVKIDVPSEAFDGGFKADFSVYGNQNDLEITNFSVKGENCFATSKLSYNYKNARLAGIFELPYFRMKNGKTISTEIYFEALEKGFMAFSPQIFIENQALTAVEFTVLPGSDSFDFKFEAFDYSHSFDFDSLPGKIQMDGSYLLKSNYVQASVLLNTIYADSAAGFVAEFLNDELSEKLNKMKNLLSPYALSGDLYFSSDFKSLSYNVPYVLFANTEKENQAAMISVNGNEQNFQLDNLSLVYGKIMLDASGIFEYNRELSDMFFAVDLKSASIPYHFTGSVMPGVFVLSGDYDAQVEIRFEQNKKINGSVQFKNLPVNFSDNTTIFSSDTNFSYDALNGPEITLRQFEAEFSNINYMTNPKLTLTGNIAKYGAQFDSIAYNDLYSSLEGEADVAVNVNNSIFDSAGVRINVKNPVSQEKVVFDGAISNPDRIKLNKNNFMENLYLNVQLDANSFGLNRFGLLNNENNEITASLYASGVLENPYVSLNVQNSSMLLASKFLKLNGSAVLEDKVISINDFNVKYDFLNISDIAAQCSLEDKNLLVAGNLRCDVADKILNAPVKLQISNVVLPQNSKIPDSFSVSLEADSFSGSALKKNFPLTLKMYYADKNFLISSSENAGINGVYDVRNGLLDLFVDNKDFLSFGLGGIVKSENLNLSLYDANIDLKKLLSYLNFDDILIVDKGFITGNVMISDSFENPDFSGSLTIPSPNFRLPSISKQKLTSDDIVFNFNRNEIKFENATIKAKNNQKVDVEFDFILNKWFLERIEGGVKTQKKELFPIKLTTSGFVLEGDVSADLKLAVEGDVFDVSGKVFGENVNLSSSVSLFPGLNPLQNLNQNENSLKLQADLDITLGTHSSINLEPVLRCVFVPNTAFSLKINQELEQYSVNGELKVRSGDVSYLSRNFYIKSGSLKFNPEEILNPIVTLQAEIREKDYKGQTVKIIMSVENQYLSEMTPKFTSDPAKSENEIRVLLGQIVTADSDRPTDLLFAASDYALQSTVMRSVENKLRDLLNFDIFSVRTNVLQNALSMGVSGELSKNNVSIGNFLDNSTVYIGRYLGSSLYVDAMLHVSFENALANDIISVGRPIFQPEFGLELESPFSNIPINLNSDVGFLFSGPNIRINMAPDINALLNGQFVPSASLTLSWKLTF